MNPTDLCYTPATEIARLIRSKALSPVEVARAVLERIERVNPALTPTARSPATSPWTPPARPSAR